jgi:uncharacterized membrane protein
MMTLRRSLTAYLGAGLILGMMDAAWLTVSSNLLYKPAIGDLLAPAFRPLPAALFYLLYLVGLVIFAISPGLRSGRWKDAALKGALYGVFCYATYDLTNQATLVHWATRVTVLDIAWGAILSASGASAGFFAARAFGGPARAA